MLLQTLRKWRTPRPRAARGTRRRLLLESLEDRTVPSTFFVYGFGGSDTFGNGSAAAPFASIQRAVNLAQNGDTVEVAGGVYRYNPALDQVNQFFGTTGVVDVVNKQLNILGSFDASFQTQNIGLTPSVIDGSIPGFGNVRGVFLTGNAPGQAALNMQDFFIQNGVGQSIPARAAVSPASAVNGYGGGMLAELSGLSLSTVVFQDNVAFGVSTAGQGGVGAGGGLAIFSAAGPVSLLNLSFLSNQAIGGNGGVAGGNGQGGGLFADTSTVLGTNLAFALNSAQGGSTPTGAGSVTDTGNGFGGAVNFEQLTGDSVLTGDAAVALNPNIPPSFFTVNAARGGNAPMGTGGEGLGGAIEDELGQQGTLTISNVIVSENTALGGSGPNATAGVGSLAVGGGIDSTNSNVTVNQSVIFHNTAQAGDGSAIKPGPLGGGLHALSTRGVEPGDGVQNAIVLTGTTVMNNLAAFGAGQSEQAGGSGGGAAFVGTNVTLTGDTFDGNAFGPAVSNLQGEAISANSATGFNTSATITNTRITNHTNSLSPPAAAVHVFPGSSATFSNDVFFGNTKNTNADGQPFPGGTFIGLPSSQF
jgi:hypothetical protein